ncbi:MAG: hypothetical protein ABII25_09105, partial [bacterium]
SKNSKKVGELVITLNWIKVSSDKITVMLEIFNQSAKKYKIQRASNKTPSLIDEKANIFSFGGGLLTGNYAWKSGKYPTLEPNSKFYMPLFFKFKDSHMDIKEIGNNFIFSLNYNLYDVKTKSGSQSSVSFADIKP